MLGDRVRRHGGEETGRRPLLDAAPARRTNQAVGCDHLGIVEQRRSHPQRDRVREVAADERLGEEDVARVQGLERRGDPRGPNDRVVLGRAVERDVTVGASLPAALAGADRDERHAALAHGERPGGAQHLAVMGREASAAGVGYDRDQEGGRLDDHDLRRRLRSGPVPLGEAEEEQAGERAQMHGLEPVAAPLEVRAHVLGMDQAAGEIVGPGMVEADEVADGRLLLAQEALQRGRRHVEHGASRSYIERGRLSARGAPALPSERHSVGWLRRAWVARAWGCSREEPHHFLRRAAPPSRMNAALNPPGSRPAAAGPPPALPPAAAGRPG
ncbi:hypothetical protein MPEAHAMD_0051 [Methylobacterium frigidaeris]|uniref:Uncharacterized protein n=1 Tax=Methylobacterium frigidaeris TaxID=2038277 RepID=A0AA37M1S6_9HYPH|nr:hypothetical protein MPEAHAMD_0051 [Methylobacterium frigidaeris]